MMGQLTLAEELVIQEKRPLSKNFCEYGASSNFHHHGEGFPQLILNNKNSLYQKEKKKQH